jgi:hypothetical protein
LVPRQLNAIWRRFETLRSIFIGGVSRKINRDETAREFTEVKVWLKNSLSLSKGVDGEGVSEKMNKLWRETTPKWRPVVGETALFSFRRFSPLFKQVQKGSAGFA